MSTMTLEEAQANLAQIIAKLAPGDEILILKDEQPVARLTAEPAVQIERKLGTMRGSILYMSPDFDAPLEEFKEYME